MGEFWLFLAANLVEFAFGSVLTGLSYYAYRSPSPSTVFRLSTLGFAFLTIGGAVEPIYMIGIEGDFYLAGSELLIVQGVEGILVALGLGLLFCSITGYRRRPRSSAVSVNVESDCP